eukprot:CAMPEP_0171267912 /NCGR_PEP_ID=MMETSP0790-20130122/59399_1 /TAXON_ID=2925 /ORGANISM="Alexandrium catenella, Strain OF101" /LENGTH=47 /DNA_ID= /DNA_START= /DNA_END= /DNA_ORIENTATION=
MSSSGASGLTARQACSATENCPRFRRCMSVSVSAAMMSRVMNWTCSE